MFRKKNEISFFTAEGYENLPHPYPAYKHFPDWFKKSDSGQSKCPFTTLMKLSQLQGNFKPSTDHNQLRLVKNSTVKNCPGIVDYLKTGYVLPLWTDIVIRNINGGMVFDSAVDLPEDMDYSLHKKTQYMGMSEEQMPEMSLFHKISSPWWIKTPPGVSVLITHPYWSREKNFTSVSAIAHTDQNPMHLKWFFEFNKAIENNKEIYDESLQVIKKDTPVALIIPFRRESFTHSINYLSREKMNLIKKDNQFYSVSWFGDSLYDKFRKSFNIWHR